VLKFLTSIEEESWQQYARMIENNQQLDKLTMKLIYKKVVGFNILEHMVEVNAISRESFVPERFMNKC